MKKFTVLMLAALLVVAFTVPASALENTFGGYWRTRFVEQRNFSGDTGGAKDNNRVDTRTRLYYTAKLNDNLKFVNKFEFNTVWGQADGTAATGAFSNWGDGGADGVGVAIKNSYADFNVGPVNFLVGVQGFSLGRGFVTDDDAAGMKAILKVNDGLYLPFVWMKMNEGGIGKSGGVSLNKQDTDAYVFAPIIMLSKDIKINPYVAFLHSQDASVTLTNDANYQGRIDNLNAQVYGIDFDGKFGAASMWFSGVYQAGSITAKTALSATIPAGTEIDLRGWLVAAGGKFNLGKADIHGQAIYATGDSDGLADKELDGYFLTRSQTYYWSEILGNGIFDNMSPVATGQTTNAYGSFTGANGGPQITNMWTIGLGSTFKPTDKLSITGDLWYAKLAEKNVNGDDALGVEADLVVTYKLAEGLTLDIVGAYLFAGDAIGTTSGGSGAEDPYEFGTRLSLSF